MPTYKGNRGNLLQHWLLCELLTFLKGQVPQTTCLAFIDAYAMSPYATRDSSPGPTSSDFEVVRKLLPGRNSTFEQTWKDLSGVPRVEYPTSAMFASQLWPGPLHMVLCEKDEASAEQIIEWRATLPSNTQVEVHGGDWRPRFRRDFPRSQACLVSFDPYVIVRENPAETKAGNMYLCDLIRAASAILEIRSGPLLVQLSTYDARSNSHDEVLETVRWIMAAAGLSLIADVRADGHMMSMVFGRNFVQEPTALDEAFRRWLRAATGPPGPQTEPMRAGS
jgi:hypothetical protein